MLKKASSGTGNKTLLAGVALLALCASGMYVSARAQELPQDQPVAVIAPAAPSPETGVPVVPSPETGVPVALSPETGVPVSPPPAASGDAAMESAAGTYEEMDPAAFAKLDESMASMTILRKDIVKPQEIGTLVFTLWQHALLQDAKRLFTTRRPTDADMAAAGSSGSTGDVRPRGVRELGLNGILYKSKDNWVVWLNGKRMAPGAIPKEIIDINVSKDYIDLKWFDAYSNLIYPVRMRPHQRFNLDSRIFLPGITADAAAQLQAVSTGQ